MKVMIVVLIAIAVAALLVLFYGAVRPAGDAGEAQGGVGGGVGFLVPRPTLEFADVADADCADPVLPGFSVGAAGCAVSLPDPSQIILCSPDPGTVVIRTNGDEYPTQTVKASALSCTNPEPIPIYDTDTRLTIQCLVATECAVIVVPER